MGLFPNANEFMTIRRHFRPSELHRIRARNRLATLGTLPCPTLNISSPRSRRLRLTFPNFFHPLDWLLAKHLSRYCGRPNHGYRLVNFSANMVNSVRFRLTSTAPRLPRPSRLATAKLSNYQRAEPPRGSFRLRASGRRIIHDGPGKTGVWRRC